MAITKKRLHGPGGIADVRLNRTAADAASWTPENEGTPDDVILDAREWETVRLVADFHDANDNIVAGGTVTLTPLIGVRDYQGSSAIGRRWVEGTQIAGATVTSWLEVPVEGHLLSFRINSLALAGAHHFDIRVTAGKKFYRETM